MSILLQTALFSALLCGLHRSQKWLGLAPLYLTIGLFEVFLWTSGKVPVYVELVGTSDARVPFVFFLPLLLTTFVLIYVLEGTRAARHLIVALIVVYAVHGLFDVLMMQHAETPPTGRPNVSDEALLQYSTADRIASLGAIIIDIIVIIVVYQFFKNRFSKIPSAFPLLIGLILAMTADAFFYKLFSQGLVAFPKLFLVQKAQAGLAAGLPLAFYLDWQLRKYSDEVRGHVLERGAFDILDLRDELEREREQYEKMQKIFRRYVSDKVADALGHDPDHVQLGGEDRVVTILFADIRGYSTLSEALRPSQIIDLLNAYFGRVSDVILSEEGMINEFEGDAVLAVFGAPLEISDHAARAIYAAERMLAVVEELNAQWEADGTAQLWHDAGVEKLAIRVGIHTGHVVAGNIGSEARMKYAVIGDTVNIASRIEGLNKTLNTSVLLSAESARAAKQQADPNRALPDWEDRGAHAVKGRSEPVHVYSFRDSAVA